jgi:predicted amidohydrolase
MNRRAVAPMLAAGLVGCAAVPTAERAERVTVAAIQCSSVLGDVEGNRRKLTALVEEAARSGARIVVLPETAITGYLSQDLKTTWHVSGRPIDPAFTGKDPRPFAETVPGPSTQHFAQLAGRLGIYLTIPLVEVEPGPEGRLFNTVCLASPSGEIVAHYRKLTPWPPPEQSWATPGDRDVQRVDTEYGRVGLAICYDVHTILERYAPHRLWALLYPMAWVDESHPAEWFWHTLPERTAPFGHYVVGANWSVDAPEPWRGYGFSVILSPTGRVLATARSLYGSEIVYATIETRPASDQRPASPRSRSASAMRRALNSFPSQRTCTTSRKVGRTSSGRARASASRSTIS